MPIRLWDENARRNIRPYVLQCVLATLSILVFLLVLDVNLHTGIIATLGSSAFIVFAMPTYYTARARPLIGGYAIGTIVGVGCYNLCKLPLILNIPISISTSYVIFSALSVGLAIFLMVVTDTEHPPAAGMALSLVLGSWNIETLFIIAGAVVALSLIRRVLKPIMIDLI